MRYIGGVEGEGVLRLDGQEIGRAAYDFDSYFNASVGITSCGEVRLSPATLRGVFGRRVVQLLTDDGRLLNLTFSDKELRLESDAAHVDVTGDIPSEAPKQRH
ncbi:hypothetical protein V5F77_17990 [Xanthobacter sp. DSM 24535]|uniref:hypothetical protein n=1 Tax=Roseixanthobacter psychrophilus TaxID=3119917 RepID=UPI003728D67E